jgi:uncharacterized membrane protein (DUF373 family)
MINTIFSKLKINEIYRMFGFKSMTIQVLDSITNTNSKQKMFMEIFRLHSKFYENADFDNLFMNILDSLLTIENYEEFATYLDISAQVVTDNGITEDILREVLIDWIYSEPFFRRQIINEIPSAEANLSSPPIAHVSFV